MVRLSHSDTGGRSTLKTVVAVSKETRK